MTAGPSPEYRAAIERVEQAERMAELEAGFRAFCAVQERLTPRQRRIAQLQAEVARRYPDPVARMAALTDPKPGTPEAALFNVVLGKPGAFVADRPDTFSRVE